MKSSSKPPGSAAPVRGEKDLARRIAKRCRREGLALEPVLLGALTTYLELLWRWNERINLTSLEDRDQAVDRLVVEPLLARRFLPADAAQLLDVGSGGGSPAVPLKLAAPHLTLRMVEAKTRKSAFLREVIRQLGLDRTIVETSRYEELLARPDLHEAADLVTLRAVRLEGRVLTTLQAFLAPGGQMWLFRGPSGADVPATITPPLHWTESHALVESLRSRLVVLTKGPVRAPLGSS